MNDFTKDELETLLHGLKHANIHDWEIGKKIQSMIDNYCDHISLFSMDDMKHCCKCGEWFNDNQ